MRGGMVPQFSVGQHVHFKTGPEEMARTDGGTIVKLHKSGSAGSAEIRPDPPADATTARLPSKVTRSLRFVSGHK